MAFFDISPPIYVSIPKNNGITVEMPRHPGAVVPIPSGAQGLPGEPGFSPVVSVEEITGGNRVTITDAEGETSFDVMNGAQGAQGEPGEGVPAGGAQGQVLKKASNNDYDTVWANESGTVLSVNGQTGAVILDADDVGALPDTTVIPTKTSDLTNDSGFINATQAAAAAPVQSVNGQTGNVSAIPSGGTAGQVLTKSSGTDYATEWKLPLSIVGPLWTNPNPTSSFAAQTVSLDLSGYDAVRIVFKLVNGSGTAGTKPTSMISQFVNVGDGGLNLYFTQAGIDWPGTAYLNERSFEVSTTGVYFYDNRERNGNSNNNNVPIYIYGIKGIQSL